MYVLAQSQARIHKERAMRRRKLKWLWARLKQIAAMDDLSHKEMLMKLGAAPANARAAWRLLDVEVAKQDTTFTFALNGTNCASTPPRRTTSATHQSVRRGSGQAVEVLRPARRNRSRVQESPGRSAAPPDSSPTRASISYP